jgi:hypothetical protein
MHNKMRSINYMIICLLSVSYLMTLLLLYCIYLAPNETRR